MGDSSHYSWTRIFPIAALAGVAAIFDGLVECGSLTVAQGSTAKASFVIGEAMENLYSILYTV